MRHHRLPFVRAVPRNLRSLSLKLARFGARFPTVRRQWIGFLICAILLACLVSPFVETSVHSQGNIFNSGQDNESTVAVLALCTALALAVASLVSVCCLWASVGSALSVDISRVSFFACLLSICLDTSPPLTLRI